MTGRPNRPCEMNCLVVSEIELDLRSQTFSSRFDWSASAASVWVAEGATNPGSKSGRRRCLLLRTRVSIFVTGSWLVHVSIRGALLKDVRSWIRRSLECAPGGAWPYEAEVHRLKGEIIDGSVRSRRC